MTQTAAGVGPWDYDLATGELYLSPAARRNLGVPDNIDIILADLSQYQMIQKGGVQAASSIHVQFLTDETAYRFVYRVDGQPAWHDTLTPHKGSSPVSPFVALATRA